VEASSVALELVGTSIKAQAACLQVPKAALMPGALTLAVVEMAL